jgi:Short C-terminal domain
VPAADDLAAQIQRLGDLHAAGTLTDDEFAAANARLLG